MNLYIVQISINKKINKIKEKCFYFILDQKLKI